MECSLRTGLKVWRLTGLYHAAQEIKVEVFHVGQRWFIPVPLTGSPPLFILFHNFSFLSFFLVFVLFWYANNNNIIHMTVLQLLQFA